MWVSLLVNAMQPAPLRSAIFRQVSAVVVQATCCVRRHLKQSDANGLRAGVSGMRIAC